MPHFPDGPVAAATPEGDGYFTVPYPYLTGSKLSNDFWTMLQVA